MLYHLSYKVESIPSGVSHEEAIRRSKEEREGFCTAVVVGSLLYPEDGTYSAAFVTLDGRTGEPLSDAELWKAWNMLAVQLARSESLSPNKRELCQLVWDAVCRAMEDVRKNEAEIS